MRKLRTGGRKDLNYHDILLLEPRLEIRSLGFCLKRENALAGVTTWRGHCMDTESMAHFLGVGPVLVG